MYSTTIICSHLHIVTASSDILKKYWGYDTFRPLQEEIIQSVLANNDALALLPTGGGKSICYQVPALAQEGICLVISPLIALMKDQVEGLKKKGIMALAIHSGLSRRAIIQTLKNAGSGEYKFLYVSPERLETDLFKEYLPALNINLIAVDEAHCISQWGYDFRPSYLKISELRKEVQDVALLALTASATPEVQKDICDKLGISDENIYRQSYKRPNLSYSAFKVEAKQPKLVEILTKVQGSALVYCKSRRRTVEIARLLQMHSFSAEYYHAGLQGEERGKRQQAWITGETKIMVCTNAFGMGIDKPDVRVVVHVDVPDGLEAYYQEAGRAGRDGKKSYAVLLHNNQDTDALKELHKSRFPSFEDIKKTYSALVNFLHIPAYSGEDVTYAFKFNDWVKHFQLPPVQALYALKALEADGWLQFNEQNFMPSTIEFTTTKKELYAFQSDHPHYEPLLTTLLRTYEGIFDHPCFVSEKAVAGLLHVSQEEVLKLIYEATRFGVIEYKPQSDIPQIIFRKQRVPVNDLRVDLTLYNNRRLAFIARIEKMIAYTSTKSCRSTYINEYFGDATLPCGVCDNCLSAKATPLTTEEFDLISKEVIAGLAQPTTTAQLIQNLRSQKKEKVWKVLLFLQSEGKIATDTSGKIQLKKTSAAAPSAGSSA